MSGAGPPRTSGFTVIEVLVAAGILLLVLMLAGQMLLESQRMMMRSSQELVASSNEELALAYLRSDLQTANGAAGEQGLLPPVWTSGYLDVAKRDEGVFRYRLNGQDLERLQLDGNGEPTETRVLLREVLSWQWRAAAPGLLDVQLVVTTIEAPRGVQILEHRRRSTPSARITHLRVALRGNGGTAW